MKAEQLDRCIKLNYTELFKFHGMPTRYIMTFLGYAEFHRSAIEYMYDTDRTI